MEHILSNRTHMENLKSKKFFGPNEKNLSKVHYVFVDVCLLRKKKKIEKERNIKWKKKS